MRVRRPLANAALVGLICSFGVAATVASPTVAAAAARQPGPAALALAEMVLPAKLSLETNMRMAKQGFDAELAKAEAKELEQQYPGIYAAIWKAAEPEFRAHSERTHPRHLQKVASFYQEKLSTQEIEALRRFYGTPTGQKLIRAMYSSFNGDAVIAEAQQGQTRISADALAATQASAKQKAAMQMGKEDEPALLDLGRSLSMPKIQGVVAEMQKMFVEMANEQDPAFDARVEKIVQATVSKYIEDRQPAD